jgi:predicted enzyme related to lactoylglutathione lyase
MTHEQIQYIEFLSNDFTLIKAFYAEAFGWEFTDYGPEYTAFAGECVEGGFALGEPAKGSILVIVYSKTLEKTKEKVEKAGGSIVKDIFSFPGGRRFHFTDPDGNELGHKVHKRTLFDSNISPSLLVC